MTTSRCSDWWQCRHPLAQVQFVVEAQHVTVGANAACREAQHPQTLQTLGTGQRHVGLAALKHLGQ